MAHPAHPPLSRVLRFRHHTPVPSLLLAVICALPLGGCSFDLGSWGSDKEKPQQQAEQKPTDNISARSVTDAQGYATRGQVLAKSGNNEEALAEFERALALDPYNVRALYGRGLIRQAEKEHQQAIEDFTAANGLSPQKVEPLLARANSYFALDKAKKTQLVHREIVIVEQIWSKASKPSVTVRL